MIDSTKGIAGLKGALRYVRAYRDQAFVVKLGGDVMKDPAALDHVAGQLALLHSLGIRLMVVHGIIQRDEDIIHVFARRLEDGTFMLRHLSDGLMPSTLNQGDGGGSWRPPAGRHPRDVSIIPKSRDFH